MRGENAVVWTVEAPNREASASQKGEHYEGVEGMMRRHTRRKVITGNRGYVVVVRRRATVRIRRRGTIDGSRYIQNRRTIGTILYRRKETGNKIRDTRRGGTVNLKAKGD